MNSSGHGAEQDERAELAPAGSSSGRPSGRRTGRRTASHSRTTRNIVPTAAAEMPDDVGVVVEQEGRAQAERQVVGEVARRRNREPSLPAAASGYARARGCVLKNGHRRSSTGIGGRRGRAHSQYRSRTGPPAIGCQMLSGPTRAVPAGATPHSTKPRRAGVAARRGEETAGEKQESGVLAPTAAQREGGGLGLAVAGEGALLVAADPHDPGGGGEVGEVPDLLADDGVDRGRRRGGSCRGSRPGTPRSTAAAATECRPGIGVRAVLGDDDRLALARPALELLGPGHLGGGEVAGVDVPAVVAVEHEHVAELGDAARRRAGRA